MHKVPRGYFFFAKKYCRTISDSLKDILKFLRIRRKVANRMGD